MSCGKDSDWELQDKNIAVFDTKQQHQITRTLMQKIDQSAFEWAMREHLLEDGNSEYLASQYQIICDHLRIGKETLDFVLLKPQYEGMITSALKQSISRKYNAFQKELVRQAVLSEINKD